MFFPMLFPKSARQPLEIPSIPQAWIPYIIAGVVAIVALKILSSIMTSNSGVETHELKRCSGCGWTGKASKHRPVCPKCAAPMDT